MMETIILLKAINNISKTLVKSNHKMTNKTIKLSMKYLNNVFYLINYFTMI